MRPGMIAALSVAGSILLFSIISMITVMIIYQGQFPRFERPDTSITAVLRYEDLADQYPRTPVGFTSGTDRLQGYVYGEHQGLGLVVLSHGLGGGADSYLPQITYLVDRGWRVFAYDATGSFDSEGKTTKGFSQALIDLDAALKHISTQQSFGSLPILLFGHSWGRYASAAVLHYDHEIAGVVSISGANSPIEMIMEQGRSMLGGFITTQYPFLWLYERILFGKRASLQAIEAISQSEVPVLIIHGIEDTTVSYHGSSIISHAQEITDPRVRTMTLSDPGRSGHTDLLRSQAAIEYIDRISIIYRELYDHHAQEIPYEIKQEFYAAVDRSAAQEVNSMLMDEIHAFFLESTHQTETDALSWE
ncbi:MAG: lysophospholipase [Spirochaetia bacterium]|nr:lysophospholipase [Spirochaetia bacterium]